MKVKLLAMCLLSSVWSSASAQDSLAVSFSEEQDTLVKQHFIDRYENIFMTKVPTRHMLKADMASSEMSGKGIYVGYEYKLFPFLSVEAGIFAQASNFDPNRWDETIIFQLNNPSIWASGKVRWYYNMNRRIRTGLSANNFTGSYAGFQYDHPLSLDYFHPNHKDMLGRLGLVAGYQGRFLQNGHFDFSIGLFNRQIGTEYRYGEDLGLLTPANFAIGTQMSLGVAMGDWKRQRKTALCDVLICDEHVESHWKLLFPDISVGIRHQRALAMIMYERQVGQTPFSVQIQFESNYWRDSYNGQPGSRLTLIPGIQLRSYFLQKSRERKGLGGSSLSGMYAALVSNYMRFDVNQVLTGFPDQQGPVKYRSRGEYLNAGVKVGYQQRLFGRMFIDVSYGYGWHFPVKRIVGYPYGSYPDRYDAFNLSTGIGLTF
ncbi:DUF3575 domain-containing protein [Dyadobacter sp. CY261]|uniref:DUF3575 domain-containing protein n=1 Tax=Dyadobacter sp. CY261 TaxID=2907203 RepID=UPI001F3E93BC|nr:DUF3575 domain-containing protein [Dyadobacter sp. CY261]MCF0070219.1 DUF3575 domain-containing protein [Dyadobacter sp. CY261]